MKLKNNYFYTLREDSKDEDSVSSNLLVRSGMIKKSSAGVYMYMPLGLRVIKKIQDIVRDEMNKQGALELLMPCLIPEEVYIDSGRRNIFGNSMFTLTDRNNRNFALGPTHEELFVEAAKMQITSYKTLPFNIYQIGTKYRDEARSRFGLIRVKEFSMKDAYSFDKDLDGLEESYRKMDIAYHNIFQRVGIDYTVVKADTGAMGGLLSEEFQALTDIGEDHLVVCSKCDYSSNKEIATFKTTEQVNENKLSLEKVSTPNTKTIEEVASFLDIETPKTVKCLIYKAKDELIAVLVRGDREVNLLKLSKYINCLEDEIVLATEEEINSVTTKGYAGPINLDINIYADLEVEHMTNFVTGANEEDYHFVNTNTSDFKAEYIDLREITEEDLCPICGNKLVFKKGIEIGNIFKLGDKYSRSLNLTYQDEFNKPQFVQMGCYGIGIGRILAAYIEQHNDNHGMVFNESIAPFNVSIIIADCKNPKQLQKALELYDKLNLLNIDVMLDDRNERAGVKFKDSDLLGIPHRVVVGRSIEDDLYEYKNRTEEESSIISLEEVLNKITKN